jgi:glycosyltransferase involved in cell wall biosynthesis
VRVCSPHCGIAPDTTSGGETYERELLTRLGHRGIGVDIILARGKRHPDGIPNWTVHRFPIRRGLRWWVAPLVVPSAIRRVWQRTPFHLLRAHSLRYIGPSALWARRHYRLDVPVVGHHHHLDASPLNRVIERRVIEACDHIVTVSRFSRGQLESQLSCRTDHVSVVHNGVDERFAPGPRDAELEARLGLGHGPRAMFLGGLKPRKNLDFLLDVWREVVRQAPGTILLIAGGGPCENALRRRAAELSLTGSVSFSGRIAEADKVRLYNLADVFVSASSLEGFGFTVAEAMSCGLPVVVSACGALPELVGDEPGGAICRLEEPPAFVSALVGLLSSSERRQHAGQLNRHRINTAFRWDRATTQVQEIYADLIGRRQAARRSSAGR